MNFAQTLAAAGAFCVCATVGSANEFEGALRDFFSSDLAPITADAALISAVKAQNDAHAGLTEDEILSLDTDWRAAVDTGGNPQMASVLEGSHAEFLRTQKENMGGLITEVFVMDNRGLNVASSDLTSDYWQGDEAKFSETYGVGPGAVHISEVEFDESSQSYQSQVSSVIVDPATGSPIGAITFGVAVEMLP